MKFLSRVIQTTCHNARTCHNELLVTTNLSKKKLCITDGIEIIQYLVNYWIVSLRSRNKRKHTFYVSLKFYGDQND